jgi:16S rRNA (guanine(1405)-N(7))-methyltransferase
MKNKGDFLSDPVDRVVASVKESVKYREISEALIRHIGAQEVKKRSNLREAIKATRNKLHQVGGAYLDRPVDYEDCLAKLKLARESGKDDFLGVCRQVMCYHSSTRERLPIIDQFYITLLAELPPVHTILDVACGFNPLAIPWMGLPENIEYNAVDIYGDMINFINQFFNIAEIRGNAFVGDVMSECPSQSVDVAFVLKTIPCLEQVEKSAGYQLVNNLQAKHVVVSFPVHSLGGRRDKGMVANYSSRFNELVANKSWLIKKLEFQSELVFLVSKS